MEIGHETCVAPRMRSIRFESLCLVAKRKMARASNWRRTCPDSVRRTMDELQGATVYLLHQTGPTGFVVKAENNDKKCKVSFRSPLIKRAGSDLSHLHQRCHKRTDFILSGCA